MTINWTVKEQETITQMAKARDLSEEGLIRLAMRLYELWDYRVRSGYHDQWINTSTGVRIELEKNYQVQPTTFGAVPQDTTKHPVITGVLDPKWAQWQKEMSEDAVAFNKMRADCWEQKSRLTNYEQRGAVVHYYPLFMAEYQEAKKNLKLKNNK